jgi:hypothetical protein
VVTWVLATVALQVSRAPERMLDWMLAVAVAMGATLAIRLASERPPAC